MNSSSDRGKLYFNYPMPTSKCEEPHKVQWSINLHDWVPPTDASFEVWQIAGKRSLTMVRNLSFSGNEEVLLLIWETLVHGSARVVF
ncbi:hypothetical protein TNIN_370201 [Trichonephila inaurata madagascariensis]|uniref:Uncharacterized protein n=1 Tax=Trichonephila inaurata madagascariensis TaxID=2747483 RepID=A0A8X6M7N7_9ARAC|nr:hypothetical protein TNIN_370201 [Trichonephila inaurata madagascariensis]